jgi:transposase
VLSDTVVGLAAPALVAGASSVFLSADGPLSAFGNARLDALTNGQASFFAALDVATGKVIGECYPKKRAVEFRRFLQSIANELPDDLDVHMVVDNSSIHGAPEVKRWLRRHPRFHLHFTPTYSSWLNLVERWFANLTEDALRRGSHRSTRELEAAIRAYVEESNAYPRPFVWTKSADEIIASVARFCAHTLAQADS